MEIDNRFAITLLICAALTGVAVGWTLDNIVSDGSSSALVMQLPDVNLQPGECVQVCADVLPTITPAPTATPIPSTETPTPLPPTDTPAPPTSTPTPAPSGIPVWVSSTSQEIADAFQPFALAGDGLYGRAQNIDIIAGFDGGKALIFNSWADAEANVDLWADMDYVGYNPERNHTPGNEIADLAAVCAQAQAFAHENGVLFMLAPEMFFSDSQPELAAFADVYGLQIQRYQTDQARLDAIKSTMVPALRQAAPDTLLYGQFGVGPQYGGPGAALAAIEFLALDGVQLFVMPDEVDGLVTTLEELRQ